MAALLFGAAIRMKASTSLQVSDVLGKTLVDWLRGNFHCELIQHPGSPWNRSYNLLHFVVLVLSLIIP